MTEPKISEEIDLETLAFIIRRSEETKAATVQGNCECCSAPMVGTLYDTLRQPMRLCQVCKMLGEKPKPFKSGSD